MVVFWVSGLHLNNFKAQGSKRYWISKSREWGQIFILDNARLSGLFGLFGTANGVKSMIG